MGPVGLIWRTVVVHTVTYALVGMVAFVVFDYAVAFTEPGLTGFMRPTDHPLVQAGVLFQPIRGVLFGLVFHALREVLFRPRGWRVMWLLLVVVGIFSTFGPSPGSVEGLIYTQVPVGRHSLGLIEVLLQSLLLSWVLHAWVTHPRSPWPKRVLVPLFILLMVLPAVGLLAAGVRP